MEKAERTARPYRSERRAAQAAATRRRILEASSDAFLAHGYGGTTMQTIARHAGVSVPTLEATFGTKATLLKAAIDVAIAGDDKPVPVLQREWAAAAVAAPHAGDLVAMTAGVVLAAQQRSAGLVLAAFEGSAEHPELAALADQLTAQRATTARWIVDALARKAPLRHGWTDEAAADLIWVLMDPAVYVRLIRDRGWTRRAYRDWWARSIELLVEPTGAQRSSDEGSTR